MLVDVLADVTAWLPGANDAELKPLFKNFKERYHIWMVELFPPFDIAIEFLVVAISG